MALVTSEDYQLVPDVLGSTQKGLQIGRQAQQLRGVSEQRDVTQQTRALTGQILDPQSTPQEKAEAQRQLSALNPQAAQQLSARGDTDRTRKYTNAAQLGVGIQGLQSAEEKISYIKNSGLPEEEYIGLLRLYQSGKVDQADALVQSAVSIGERSGFIETRGGATGLASAKTEILESGATIQALPSGRVEVRNPSGQLVTGKSRLDVLQEAKDQAATRQQAQADLTVETARRTEQVKDATESANKAFDLVDKTRQNIANLRQVIPLIGQGANTGPITSLFPSFKAETVRLENLQKRLSLDVVGAVTFGALSKGELDLAKAVAIPLGLSGDELIQWTNDKIAAQEKLANYYEEQAIFLSQGNTQADWLIKQRNELKSLASEADIRQTMKDNNLTRPEVIAELKRRKAGGR